MIKFLFLDCREIETLQGFRRELQNPVKHAHNPLFVAEEPWENGNMQLYGSVIKAEGRPYQAWYTVIHRPWNMFLAYAESDDGIVWRKPRLDLFPHNGEKTNIVFAENPHGAAVLYDAADPREDWRYKMVAGTDPSGCISAYHSADGIHWQAVRRYPIVCTNPDCPMGFLRAPDGRYVIYHRLQGYGRRVFRSESWDFVYWSGEPRMVMEPDAGDPPQIQFYGMGVAPYGSYELGTLWIYHTDPTDCRPGKPRGYQEAELTYARSGYAWHRVAQGTPFIPHGQPGSWEQGNLQCASAPVFLDREIRYYYMGSTMSHQVRWELEPQTAGLGLATQRPDGFVALCAGQESAVMLTRAFTLHSGNITVNAETEQDGWVSFELLSLDGNTLPGYDDASCVPIKGDSIAHPLRWRDNATAERLVGSVVRLRMRAQNAKLYSVSNAEPGESADYWRFCAVQP